MNIILDLVPMVVFFITYKLTDINGAVISLMVSMPVCVGLMYFAPRKPSKFNYYTVALVLVLGIFTLSFDNPLFIKLKPTVLYSSLALVLTVALILRRNPIAAILGHALGEVPAYIYARLGWQWVLILCAMAIANLLVVEYMSENSWVNFKTFFMPIVIFLVFCIQAILVGKKYGFAQQTSKQ